MASTAYLKLVKNVSEHDASKVVVINTEMDDLDNSIGGMLTLSVAGSANVTLTRAQALNAVLKFTGALTGNITVYIPVIANAAITPPTTTIGALRKYTVWNATTGAFSLTVKTSAVASAGVAVTQGTKSLLAHDGTDVFSVVAGSGDALVANPLSQFAATTSAQLAGVISNETGTGVLVFNDTPTILTPTITGAVAFQDGVRQTFNPNGTNAGLNVGSQAGDPSSPSNGDLWYDSTANTLDARINGATVNLGAGGGGLGYALRYMTITALTAPADASTYYAGLPIASGYGLQGTHDIARIPVIKAGTVKAVTIRVIIDGTLASAENVAISLRLNDTTDTSLTATSQWTARVVDHLVTGLSVAVIAGDFIIIKVVTPTWATNPTDVSIAGDIYIE